jgi:hypothetical protein
MGYTSPAVTLRYQHVMAAPALALDDLARAHAAKGTHRARRRQGSILRRQGWELRGGGAGDGNRTRVTSLEGASGHSVQPAC